MNMCARGVCMCYWELYGKQLQISFDYDYLAVPFSGFKIIATCYRKLAMQNKIISGNINLVLKNKPLWQDN